MIEARKVLHSYKSCTNINNNNKKNLHHFIYNIHNLYITFLVFLGTVIKRCILNRFIFFMIL